MPVLRAFWYKSIQVITLATTQFLRDKIQLRASALTFYLILSIVPLLAMAFGIAEGFGLSALLERELASAFQGQEQVLDFSLKFAHSLLDTTKGEAIAGVGIVVLFWSVVKLLNHIEDAFNRIWKVAKDRNFLRKLTDYFSILLFAPILLILASSATVFITTYIENISVGHEVLTFLSSAVLYLIQFTPYFLFWLLFTLLYIILPNTKVDFLPALIAGVVAGTAFQLTQWAYINFQIGVSRYNTIYGSFAALPLFMVWAQLSWVIVLLGSELSFAVQNVKRYRYNSLSEEISFGLKMRIASVLLNSIIHGFLIGARPLNNDELSLKTGIPYTLTNYVANLLIKARILLIAKDADDHEGYAPALDIAQISYGYVSEQLEKLGLDKLPVLETTKYNELLSTISRLDEYRLESERQVLIKDISIQLTDN
jgi:membrane protein